MQISKERTGEIALKLLQGKLEEEGIKLQPGEVKRQAHNLSKRFGIPIQEAAAFMRLIIDEAYGKTLIELDSLSVQATESLKS